MKNPQKNTPAHAADAQASVHDYVAERTLLADVMIYPKHFIKVADTIQVTDFHLPAHRVIYQAISNVMHSDKPVDATTVMHEINCIAPDGLTLPLRIIGDMIAHGHSVTHVDAHAAIVKNLSNLRQLQAICQEIMQRCQDPGENPSVLAQESLDKHYTIIESYYHKGLKSVHDTALELKAILQEEQQGHFKPRGFELGFRHLDDCIGGLDPGDFMVISAITGAGKSAFAMNIVQNAAKRDQRVLAFSLEMTTTNLVGRMVHSEAKVSRDKRKQRQLTNHEYERAIAGAEEVSQFPTHIDDTAPMSIGELIVKIKQVKMQHGLDAVVIDYIQLLQIEQQSKGENRDERIGNISTALKSIAKDVAVPIICLAQMNRNYDQREGYEGKKPVLGDIRESGRIAQDADIVMFLYRPEIFKIHEIDGVSTRNRAIAILAKQRNGSTGECDLRYTSEYTLFEDLQPGERSICSTPVASIEDYPDMVADNRAPDRHREDFEVLDPDMF